MKIDISVPAMGESIAEAVIGTILKPSGASVAVDDEILELETDKVNQLLYAAHAGIINWKVSPGDQVKIGQVIGEIETEASQKESAQSEKTAPKQETAEQPKANKEEEAKKFTVTEESLRFAKEAFLHEEKTPLISPVHVEPKPSETLFKKPKESSERESRKKMSTIRRVIAARLVEAQKNAAMLTTFNEVDLSVVIDLRQKYRDAFEKKYGIKLGFLSFFTKAAVAALQTIPQINSYLDGDEIVTRHYFNIGIAISSEKGLVVPVIANCDRLSFAEIEQGIASFAEKAREGGLKVDDLQGGGFTITNGGVFGSLLSTPIINPPQSAILGMHKIQKRAVVIDNQIVVRPMMYLALSYDHRLVDGKEAVTFLVHIKEFLEDPARLLLDI